nr:hypothetical protein ISGA_12595 [Gordonia sp. NB41Y]
MSPRMWFTGLRRGERRRLRVAVLVVVVALIIGALGWVMAVRSAPQPDDAERAAVSAAASEAVSALLTVTGGRAQDPAAVRAHLTEPLLTRYESQGADLVAPGAVAAGATASAQVVGVGVHEYGPERARLLVFVDQVIDVTGKAAGGVPLTGHAPSTKWVVMAKVNGTWLMSDLLPVGDITR